MFKRGNDARGHQSLFENLASRNTKLGSFVNPHAGSVRYERGAGILPAGSGGILAARIECFKQEVFKSLMNQIAEPPGHLDC